MSRTFEVEHDALLAAVTVLQRIAEGSLPPELDRLFLDLGERKDSLTVDERAHLMSWIEFTQQQSIDRAEARAALRHLESNIRGVGR